MDELAVVQHPRCRDCGTVMRDIVGGYECPSCGNIELIPPEAQSVHPLVFEGPSLRGG